MKKLTNENQTKSDKQPLSGGNRGAAQIDPLDVPGTSTDSLKQ